MRTDPTLILKYLNIKPPPPDGALSQIQAVCEEMERALTPKYSFHIFPLLVAEEGFRLGEGGTLLSGESTKKMLSDCHSAAVLTVTLGFSFDKRLNAAQKRDMAEAVILDACGSAYIETVADEAEKEIAALTGGYLTDRFSPGYGDIPLTLQKDIVRLTDAEKRLGVHVMDSFLLNPVKTITALTGISDIPQPARIRGCAFCSMNKTCAFKKGAKSCEA